MKKDPSIRPFLVALLLLVAGSAAADVILREAFEPKAGDLWIDPVVRMKFRFIPGGTFQMGSPADEEGRFAGEVRHEVVLTRGFWMGETEVTQAQWWAVMRSHPAQFWRCGGDCPVETVNWFEAVAFANALSELAGDVPCYRVSGANGRRAGRGLEYETVEWVEGCTGYRLPTEAEWERAARAGTSTAIYTGSLTIRGQNDAPELDAIAWYGGNSGVRYRGGVDCRRWPEKQYPRIRTCGPQRVGRKVPNPWNLYDMLGNVWEWTWDVGDSYRMGERLDPVGPAEGPYRVLRGGSWTVDGARFVRAAARYWEEPRGRYWYLGFRLARARGAELGDGRPSGGTGRLEDP